MVEESVEKLRKQANSLISKMRANKLIRAIIKTKIGLKRIDFRYEGLRLALQEVTDKLDKLKGESDE